MDGGATPATRSRVSPARPLAGGDPALWGRPGTKAHAEALREEIARVVTGMGLLLSPAKTLITHIDAGLDFLGRRIQRHHKRGTNKSTDVTRDPMRVRRMLGYVPQQLSAEAALTGRENVALFARLFDVPRRTRRQVVEEVLELVGLSAAADRLAGTYSGGMVRRLELAQALVNRPRLLVLDEPTIGLDPVARASVWNRIATLVDAEGMTVLVTTHYMDEAEHNCDRVALIHAGRIRAVGAPAELIRALGPQATLDDVFRHHTGGDLTNSGERLADVRRARRTAGRLG